jgi:hypothetical protein
VFYLRTLRERRGSLPGRRVSFGRQRGPWRSRQFQATIIIPRIAPARINLPRMTNPSTKNRLSTRSEEGVPPRPVSGWYWSLHVFRPPRLAAATEKMPWTLPTYSHTRTYSTSIPPSTASCDTSARAQNGDENGSLTTSFASGRIQRSVIFAVFVRSTASCSLWYLKAPVLGWRTWSEP